MKTEPLLFRFKQIAANPIHTNDLVKQEYDHSIDMVMVVENGARKPAIDANITLGTKKADMERSEDQKDSLMWVSS